MSFLKKTWFHWLIYILLLIVVVLSVNAWKTRDAPSGNLSGFEGQLLDGSEFHLGEFTGKPVLLYFWATWCPVCNFSNGSIQSISQDYPVISIASWSEDGTAVKAYMLENQLSFPAMLDNDGKLAESFGLKGVPTSFILDANGDIIFVETGYSSEIGLRLRLWYAEFQYEPEYTKQL